MAQKIIMPKQGLQMTEGTIIKWLVEEGGQVKEGDQLFEMETDKLTITIDSTATGTLLKIVHGEGDVVPIAETIAIVGEAGEDFSDLLPAGESKEEAKDEAPTAAPAREDVYKRQSMACPLWWRSIGFRQIRPRRLPWCRRLAPRLVRRQF